MAHKEPPLFTWAFVSTRPLVGGTQAPYIVQLHKDGTLSCDCPGWVFSRGDKVSWKDMSMARGTIKKCKHTDPLNKELGRTVHAEIPPILRARSEGKELPTVVTQGTQVSSGQPSRAAVYDEEHSLVVFGRVIEA